MEKGGGMNGREGEGKGKAEKQVVHI